MRKTTAALLCILMPLSLAACGVKEAGAPTPPEVIVGDYDFVLHDVCKLTTSQGTTGSDLSESNTVDTDFMPYMRITLTVDMPKRSSPYTIFLQNWRNIT